ncbi:MAG TPA: hypothetical protein VN048_20135 [Verrucomicrobiae bacterium]|jgi:hypothetical protein|nr:hypothetical protein [Verrucomicrobiae bacterium]
MKTRTLSALLVATFLLGGCSTSTKFTEYQGTDVFQGKGGGAVSDVDGIDFWEDGDADRKYKILGLIEHSRGKRPPFGRFFRSFSSSGDSESAIAKAARKNGGDAVIVLGGDDEQSGGDDFGERHHRSHKKYLVVKYVP